MAATGNITVSSSRVSLQVRERCRATLEKTIDGPSDVGDLALFCRKL